MKRLENYDFYSFLHKDQVVLDIGANAGFFSLELAQNVKRVDAVEWNPYQIKIGEKVAEYLGVSNVNFIVSDFNSFNFSKKYDVIMSFANHHTTDKGMKQDIGDYLKRLKHSLNSLGLIFF